MTIPKTSEEFAESLWLFSTHLDYSQELRYKLNDICMGLALPCLREHRQTLWGYTKHPKYPERIYMPIESDMKYLATAMQMHNSGEYFLDDILVWLNNCPLQSIPMKVDNFYLIHRKRKPFKEALMPLPKRIKLLYDIFRFTPPSPEETDGSDSGTGEGGKGPEAQKEEPPTYKIECGRE